MKDSSAADRWVAIARRLMALDRADGDREVAIPTTARADACDRAEEGPEDDDADGLAAAGLTGERRRH